ncbi:MAG: class I SAM-dependent methyltransferase [Verrucomicrobiae bacterium]|nr:class I SAM-dependent methyltransferase [Verrucomicrobiae bacterium]
MKTLERFQLGQLHLEFPDGTTKILGGEADSGPQAHITIASEDFFKKCALYGNVGLGEAYMDGDWETPDIRSALEWFIVNLHADEEAKGSSQRLKLVGFLRTLDRIGHRLRPNTKKMSRRNIEEHYDLGNDFYKLWLDSTMTYSCGRYTSPDESLESAQFAKYDALCQKLKLTAEDHVLEIGCGWGGFALHAVKNYGCRVTGVTISQAQYEEAIQRIREAGLEDRIEIRLQDYRDITGQFDKIVSIEMLEAVGDRYLETWCAKCHEVLAPEGLLAVQMITVPDCDHAELKRGADFIQKHIFPGSLLLSVGRMNQAMNRTGNLFLHGLEDIGTSYTRTLREWHDAFNARRDEVSAQGFSDRFIRKWNYYLKCCEAAFATRNISVVQGVYTRPANQRTLHREDGVLS